MNMVCDSENICNTMFVGLYRVVGYGGNRFGHRKHAHKLKRDLLLYKQPIGTMQCNLAKPKDPCIWGDYNKGYLS